jgi:RNase P subunit RPR2
MEEYNVEFVEDDFSIKRSTCPNCGSWMCFLPVIKSLIKKECKNLIDFLKGKDIEVNEVDRISVKEWTCNSCKTIYTSIKEENIIFNSPSTKANHHL